MVQVYKGREDRLRYKQVNFAARTRKFEPAETAYTRQIVVRACVPVIVVHACVPVIVVHVCASDCGVCVPVIVVHVCQ